MVAEAEAEAAAEEAAAPPCAAALGAASSSAAAEAARPGGVRGGAAAWAMPNRCAWPTPRRRRDRRGTRRRGGGGGAPPPKPKVAMPTMPTSRRQGAPAAAAADAAEHRAGARPVGARPRVAPLAAAERPRAHHRHGDAARCTRRQARGRPRHQVAQAAPRRRRVGAAARGPQRVPRRDVGVLQPLRADAARLPRQLRVALLAARAQAARRKAPRPPAGDRASTGTIPSRRPSRRPLAAPTTRVGAAAASRAGEAAKGAAAGLLAAAEADAGRWGVAALLEFLQDGVRLRARPRRHDAPLGRLAPDCGGAIEASAAAQAAVRRSRS